MLQAAKAEDVRMEDAEKELDRWRRSGQYFHRCRDVESVLSLRSLLALRGKLEEAVEAWSVILYSINAYSAQAYSRRLDSC